MEGILVAVAQNFYARCAAASGAGRRRDSGGQIPSQASSNGLEQPSWMESERYCIVASLQLESLASVSRRALIGLEARVIGNLAYSILMRAATVGADAMVRTVSCPLRACEELEAHA